MDGRVKEAIRRLEAYIDASRLTGNIGTRHCQALRVVLDYVERREGELSRGSPGECVNTRRDGESPEREEKPCET